MAAEPAAKRARPAATDWLSHFDLLGAPVDFTRALDFASQRKSAFGLQSATREPLLPADCGLRADRLGFCAHVAGTHTENVAHISPDSDVLPAVHALPVFLPCILLRLPQALDTLGECGESYLGTPAPDPSERVISARVVRATWTSWEARAANDSPAPSCVFLRLGAAPGEHAEDASENWPYLTHEAVAFLVEKDVRHLLINNPSIDREQCGRAMPAHRAFLRSAVHTVTELVRSTGVKHHLESGNGEEAEDDDATNPGEAEVDLPTGMYALNLQLVAMTRTDAVPSRVLLFPPRARGEKVEEV